MFRARLVGLPWREIGSDALILAGVAAAGYGAWLYSTPAGFVAWGAGLAAWGVILGMRR